MTWLRKNLNREGAKDAKGVRKGSLFVLILEEGIRIRNRAQALRGR